jgi:hypothetical protein
MRLHQLFKLARTTQGISLAATGAATGIPYELIDCYEKGSISLSRRALHKIAPHVHLNRAFLEGQRGCPFHWDDLIKMRLPDAGAGTDCTMIHFLAEKCTQLEVLFVHGRLKGRRRAFLMNLMEGYVSAAAVRDNEENVFFFKRRPNGEGIEDPPRGPIPDRERQLIVSLREKPIDPDLSSSPKEGQR